MFVVVVPPQVFAEDHHTFAFIIEVMTPLVAVQAGRYFLRTPRTPSSVRDGDCTAYRLHDLLFCEYETIDHVWSEWIVFANIW